MKKTLWAIIILVILAIVIGFVVRGDKKEVSGEPINIGSISALTGVGAAIGEEERKGVELAIEEINENGGVRGRMLNLVAEDVSLDKLRIAGSATQKLIETDKVVAIVGPQWDEPAAAILPITETAKIPTVGGDVTNDLESKVNFDYFFSTWYDSRVGIKKILEYSQKHNFKKISIIRPIAGGFWQFTRNIFIEMAPEYGVAILDDIDLGNPLLSDFRTHIAKIKTKNPDAVFIVTSDPTECPFLKQAKELGLNVPILSTESSGNYASLSDCPDLMENLYFSTPAHFEGYSQFEGKFVAKFGRKPQFPTAVTYYDAVGVIAAALDKTNLQGGQILRDEIARTKDYKGASLPSISFDEKGFVITPDNAFEMQTVRNGEFVEAE